MKKKLTIVEAGEVLVFILVGSRRNPQKNVRRRLSTLFIPETHSQKLLLMFQREREMPGNSGNKHKPELFSSFPP
jgi:hypothetical protein